MTEGRILDMMNRIMSMLRERLGDVSEAKAGEINAIIVLVVGADDRTMKKYRDLLWKFGYITPKATNNIYKIRNWWMGMPQVCSAENQTNLISFLED